MVTKRAYFPVEKNLPAGNDGKDHRSPAPEAPQKQAARKHVFAGHGVSAHGKRHGKPMAAAYGKPIAEAEAEADTARGARPVQAPVSSLDKKCWL